MGLIKAIMGATGGVLADQWKEFIYCDALDANTLIAKGQKRTSSQGRSSNTTSEDNIISAGSGISVNNGQCAMIIEDGKVVDLVAEPGRYTYDRSTEPSIMNSQGLGDLGQNVVNIFKQVGKRFTYGGDPGKDQRVYYVNTKEIVGNKYGTPSGIPFHIVDRKLEVDADIEIRCFGEYSYRITNPILFYTSLAGNVSDKYDRSSIDSQLKTGVLSALQDAFAKVSAMDIRYSQLPGHTKEVCSALNDVLSNEWRDLRGIEIVNFGISNVKVTDEFMDFIKELNERQLNYGLRDPGQAAAQMAGSTAKAMRIAAGNEGGMGAMMGFMGLNAAQGFGMNNMNQLYGMAAQQQAQQAQMQQPMAQQGGWTCACGTQNTGKFCSNCGKPQPAPPPATGAWVCSCGAQNTGKFCSNCGKPNPNGPWVCSCGAQNTGKFCSNCGKPRP